MEAVIDLGLALGQEEPEENLFIPFIRGGVLKLAIRFAEAHQFVYSWRQILIRRFKRKPTAYCLRLKSRVTALLVSLEKMTNLLVEICQGSNDVYGPDPRLPPTNALRYEVLSSMPLFTPNFWKSKEYLFSLGEFDKTQALFSQCLSAFMEIGDVISRKQ